MTGEQLAVDNCTECEELVDCRSQIVNGVGPDDADILLVGEAPGATEDETGEPFTGRSGTVLDEALTAAGIQRSEVRITNCVRCKPPENRDPYVGELKSCSKHLDGELLAVNPSVIVPLGRIPVGQFLPDEGKVSEIAGQKYTVNRCGREWTVIASVHPAATLYNSSLRPTFNSTFETVATRRD